MDWRSGPLPLEEEMLENEAAPMGAHKDSHRHLISASIPSPIPIEVANEQEYRSQLQTKQHLGELLQSDVSLVVQSKISRICTADEHLIILRLKQDTRLTALEVQQNIEVANLQKLLSPGFSTPDLV